MPYVNPFGGNNVSQGVQDYLGAGGSFNRGDPAQWQQLNEGDQSQGYGAFLQTFLNGWRGRDKDSIERWLGGQYNRLQNEYTKASMDSGNTNLAWLDWLAQRTPDLVNELSTTSKPALGMNPAAYLNYRTRWIR